MNGPSKVDAQISSKHFLALNSVLNKQNVLFFCLNQLNLSKYTTLEQEKHDLSPEKCLLEIQASTFEGPLLKFQYSTMAYAPENIIALALDFT